MLDLSKPIDPIDGITIFADHEQPDLFYYMPEGIGLHFSTSDVPDLSLDIYYPEGAIVGDNAEALEKSVGAILTLGVQCRLMDDASQTLRSKLASQVGHDNIRLVPPPWEDGTIQLMLLDTMSGASSSDAPQDALVKAIIGSRKPSLQDGDLSAIFQAKLDQRGAALTLAAIEGQTSSLAGVLYDLKFAALQPAVDLKMHADLNRVAEAFTMGAGGQIYYVGADISATFAQLQEQGVINVELTSEVADPEAERLVNEAVKDFYDVLMRELFQPVVPPITAGMTGGGSTTLQTSIVKFSFSYTKTEQERRVEVDYRKRSATIRTHNPQAHLHSLAGLAGGPDRVVRRVKLSSAWRDFTVEIAAPSAFTEPTLRQIRVVLWRGQDGVLPPNAAVDGGLRMPPTAAPLADFAFNQMHTEAKKLLWVSQPDEANFYRWQARFTFVPDDHIDSPSEIWTAPHVSSSVNLDLYPEILTPKHRVDFRLGEGWHAPVDGVDLTVTAKDATGTQMATRVLRISPDTQTATWAVRRSAESRVMLEAVTEVHFPDGNALKLPARMLLDSQVIANSPFAASVTITPLVVGITDDLREVTLLVQYSDEATGFRDDTTVRLKSPDFATPDITVPVLRAGDQVAWQTMAVRQSGDVRPVARGQTTGGVLTIMPNGAVRRIHVEWIGASPAEQNLRWLRATLRVHKDNGEIGDAKTIEFRGPAMPGPQDVVLPNEGTIEWSQERLFEDGQHDRTPFTKLTDDTLAIAG